MWVSPQTWDITLDMVVTSNMEYHLIHGGHLRLGASPWTWGITSDMGFTLDIGLNSDIGVPC